MDSINGCPECGGRSVWCQWTPAPPACAPLTPDQLAAVNDSDAVCEGCGANPRETDTLDGWFIDSVLSDGAEIAQIRCPRCW